MRSNHGSSFPTDQLNDILQNCQRVAVPISAWNCPFCDDWALETVKADLKALVPASDFCNHVAHHLEYICFSWILRHCSEEDSNAAWNLIPDSHGDKQPSRVARGGSDY